MTHAATVETVRRRGRSRLSHAFNWIIALSPSLALRRAIRLADQGQAVQAFPLFARAARAGIAEAEYRVARCYLKGSGVPISRTDGVHWLERAALKEHVDAQWMLAVLHVEGATCADVQHGIVDNPWAVNKPPDGETRPPDYVVAEKWARRAAERGSPEGQAVFAYILTAGPEAMRDSDAAHQWYARSAAAGCPQGSLGYALSLARTPHSRQQETEIAAHVRIAAESGLPPAIYLLGVLTERGIGLVQDREAAARLYEQAAAMGNRSGQASWGRALMRGLGVEPNVVEGESWLRRAALAGDAEAAAFVADLYLKRGDLPPNYAEAATWLQRAAEGGHDNAARSLGLLHLTGTGVARDLKAARYWLRIPAEHGDAQAQVHLANLVLHDGSGRDPEERAKARLWLQNVARSGDLVAAFNYGLCLADGIGFERNEREALHWLRRAADGIAGAQYWYGRLLVHGRGAAVDAETGRAWITRAAAVGIADAEAALAEMMVNGRGGRRDHAAAAALFEKAANKGHAGAMYALGVMSAGGFEVPTDFAAAQRWLQAAARRGHSEARQMLGRYSARAGGRDLNAARVWPGRAAAEAPLAPEFDLPSVEVVPPSERL